MIYKNLKVINNIKKKDKKDKVNLYFIPPRHQHTFYNTKNTKALILMKLPSKVREIILK